jgi:hypothetical protein
LNERAVYGHGHWRGDLQGSTNPDDGGAKPSNGVAIFASPERHQDPPWATEEAALGASV